MKSKECSTVQSKSEKQTVMKVFISSDLTNAEGNMTHYEYVKLFSQAVEMLVDGKIPLQAVPASVSLKYIKDVLPGQMIHICVWLHDFEYKDKVVFMAEFTNCNTGELHAVGVQEIHVQRRNHNLQTQLKKSKAIGQHEKLHKWLNAKRSRSHTANYVFEHKTRICFGRTSFYGSVCTFEYANIFGEVREAFGMHCIPKFVKEAGIKYVLSTNEAHYIIMEKVGFGAKLNVKMWVESFSGASFNLRAEFWDGRVLCAMAEQRIAYTSLITMKSKLPKSLKQQLRFVSGHSTHAVSFVKRVVNTIFMPFGRFLWR